MANVKDVDKGLKKIKSELKRVAGMEVAVGILQGSTGPDGTSIAEYATHNEFGTEDIPSRPFMAISVDENKPQINDDFLKQGRAMASGQRTAEQALTFMGQRQAGRIQITVTGRDILPKLADSTVAAKKGSTKTLVDSGALANAVQIQIRGRG